MLDGFIKVAALTPTLKTADPAYNKEKILELIHMAEEADGKVMVLPELCITGSDCGELFYQNLLLEQAKAALVEIANATDRIDAVMIVGLPMEHNGKLYNVAAVISRGRILGLVPKTYLNGDEGRFFTRGMENPVPVRVDDDHLVPMGTKLMFGCRQMPELQLGIEIGTDLWAPNAPGVQHALAGATVIANLSADVETEGRAMRRNMLLQVQSEKLSCGYIYCDAGALAGVEESAYAGHNLICENGVILEEGEPYCGESILTEIDVQYLNQVRRRNTMFQMSQEAYMNVEFNLGEEETELSRLAQQAPFAAKEDGLEAFIAHNVMTNGYGPGKVFRLAKYAYNGQCAEADILTALESFAKNHAPFAQSYWAKELAALSGHVDEEAQKEPEAVKPVMKAANADGASKKANAKNAKAASMVEEFGRDFDALFKDFLGDL